MDNSIVLGIDIGGSHITAALVDLANGTILENTYLRKRINSHEKAAVIINAWAEIIREAFSNHAELDKKIGIAIPGPFDYEQGISYMQGQDKYDGLYELNIKKLLAAAVGIQPDHFRFMNDACSFLKGEVLGGAAQGFDHVIGLTLGTGLGSATCHLGESKDADLWNLPFKDSIAEDYISSRWFTNYYQQISGRQVKDVKELVELASGDERVQDVFNLFGENLGLFLVEFIKRENPQVIVLGGNIALAAPLFLKATAHVLEAHTLNIPIRCATLGEKAALIGSAGCWYQRIIQ